MEYQVTIKKLDHFGRGICKIEGIVTFVADALPLEEVVISITKKKKNYNEGKVLKYITKSPERVIYPCSIKHCACQIQCLSYEKQLEYKHQKVQEILHKFYGNVLINDIVRSSNTKNYRNKITLKFNKELGYVRNKSNEIISINKCWLVSEKINQIILELKKLNLIGVEEVIIRLADKNMVILKGKTKIKYIPTVDNLYINDKLVYGEGYIIQKLGFLSFKIYGNAFFQINKDVALKIYMKIGNFVKVKNIKTITDLFCGTGTISLFLSQWANVTGIEINKDAVKSANENKKLNAINNVNFICGDANKYKIKSDMVIVDPPRGGLSKKGIDNIKKSKVQYLVYVSCNPITLARDLKLLSNFKVIEITPYDMFPNTYHVECLCILKLR